MNRRYGFFTYATPELARQAMEKLNDYVVDGRPLRVNPPSSGADGMMMSETPQDVEARMREQQMSDLKQVLGNLTRGEIHDVLVSFRAMVAEDSL
ncbi:hypothetical protein KIPB_012856 [Kipferlia bialata]|uniref:RRM domain-containing protein n=1 Tax=Kipferlia bialata TaxID=797122 RepID=A0A9K3D7R0_9EUKA|nr:hypothetical protein KIPB_012856 [Kipferlia bialata]|eukprot:g12856.t1